MNFYFFLDHPDKNLNSSVDLVNTPPLRKWSKQKIEDVYINIFYSSNNEWVFDDLGKLKANEFRTIYKNDLPVNFYDKSVFISFIPFNVDCIKPKFCSL